MLCEKPCCQCKATKHLELFPTRKNVKDGRGSVCKECLNKNTKEWNSKNKERLYKNIRAWQQRNPERMNAIGANARASRLQRTPSWLSEDELWMIEEAYILAKMREDATGIKWHVDHIVPLKGKTVSGLHVPWNLQVIPATDNIKKGNKYDPS